MLRLLSSFSCFPVASSKEEQKHKKKKNKCGKRKKPLPVLKCNVLTQPPICQDAKPRLEFLRLQPNISADSWTIIDAIFPDISACMPQELQLPVLQFLIAVLQFWQVGLTDPLPSPEQISALEETLAQGLSLILRQCTCSAQKNDLINAVWAYFSTLTHSSYDEFIAALQASFEFVSGLFTGAKCCEPCESGCGGTCSQLQPPP